MLELTSDIPDSGFHFDFEDWNICLKSKFLHEITVQLQVHIAINFFNSLRKSNEHIERHQHWRRSRSVRRTTQVQWESSHAYSQTFHWTQSKSLKPFFVQNFYHTINLIALSLFNLTLIQRQLCRIQGISVNSCSGVRVDFRYSRLWLSLWLWGGL